MILKQTARPNPHVLCPKVELTKKNSMLGMTHLSGRSSSSKGRLRVLLETPENASLPSNRSLRQYQREESRHGASSTVDF